MAIIHLTPGDSAGGSLLRAIQIAGRDEPVLPFPDDFSFGPIGEDDGIPPDRWEWWRWDFLGSRQGHASAMRAFWDRVTTTDDYLVVWWGRNSPQDCCFFSALAARLVDRSYGAIDVTGTVYTFAAEDGTQRLSSPAQKVSCLRHEGLQQLLGHQVQVSDSQRRSAAAKWLQLRRENAPFRLMSDSGLVSAPLDCFDALILDTMPKDWCRLHAVLWDIYSRQPHHTRISTGMITMRLASMVEDGRVVADIYPLDVRKSSVRLQSGF